MRSKLALLLGTLLAAAFLAACSSSDGPLGDGGNSGTMCEPAPLGHLLTMGFYALQNRGTVPVTVQNVTLPSDHGLKMTSAWLVPIQGTTLIGVTENYPPSAAVWAQRQPAAGGTIKPGQYLNLVFGITFASGRAGHSDGPAVTYTAGGSTYTLRFQLSLIIAAKCVRPPGVG